jgi:hypothetical protein
MRDKVKQLTVKGKKIKPRPPPRPQKTKIEGLADISNEKLPRQQIINKPIDDGDFRYITQFTDQQEILRRVDVVRSEIMRQVLAPAGNPLSGNDLITYINVLVQIPILIFIYKKEAGSTYMLQPHFDYAKFKYGRGSLRLIDFHDDRRKEGETIDIAKNKPSLEKLFRVFNTPYYVRCFLLDTSEDDQPFVGVTHKIQSRLQHRYEYVRICLKHLFSAEAKEWGVFTDAFTDAIFGKCGESLSELSYVQPTDGRSGKTLTDGTKYEFPGVSFFAKGEHTGGDYGMIGEISSRLHGAIEDAAFSSRILKKNALEVRLNANFTKTSNAFLMLRSYTRNYRRSVDTAEGFKGYSYDTRFNISTTQRDEITFFLEGLSRLGRDGYLKSGQPENELYGGYTNSDGCKWRFASKEEEEEHADFQKFAKSLDEFFWRLLSRKLISQLIAIFLSPIGSQSVSLVDPVYYYGSSIYRMPFRRAGGLGRLNGLGLLYRQLPLEKKSNFSFGMLRTIKNETIQRELRNDCLRVVIFYYISRMLLSSNGGQEQFDTKVHLYPVDVGGSVVGAVGKISYDFKKPETEKLPTRRRAWDEEIMFLNSVVFPMRASLRRQYRSLHIEFLTQKFTFELENYLTQQAKADFNFDASLKTFQDSLNTASQAIARICPYPSLNFCFTDAMTSDGRVIPINEVKHQSHITLGDVRLVIKQEMSPLIFRNLTENKKQVSYDISNTLRARFWSVIESTLPRTTNQVKK